MPESGSRNDPFVAFSFEVRFDDNSLGGFSECNGMNLDTQFQEFQEGGRNDVVHKFPTRTTQANLVLKRGIVDRKLWDWYFKLTQGQVEPKNVSVRVLDPAGGGVLIELRLRQALPCKWNGPELNAAQSSVAVETLELCHQGLEWQKS
jgi:phage tail-like protein